MMAMINGMQGLDELINAMGRIKDHGARKAAIAGVNAGLTELNKAIRNGIHDSSASPRMKKAARQALGKRLIKASESTSVIAAKAGFGVGKQSKRKKEKARVRDGDKSRAGVGISASNIQWPVLGTKERTAGVYQSIGGRFRKQNRISQVPSGKFNTGKMPAILAGIVQAAAASAGPAILAAMKKKVRAVLLKE